MHVTTQDRFATPRWSQAARGAFIGILIVGLALLSVGCDSGGSNGTSTGNNDGGGEDGSSKNVTVQLDESSSSNAAGRAKATISGRFEATFVFNPGGTGECESTDEEAVSGAQTPVESSLTPGSGCGSDDFDEVEVRFAPSSGTSVGGLTLSVVRDGETIESTSGSGGSLSITVSDEDLQQGGGDGGEDEGEGGGGDGGDTTAPSAPSGLSATAGNQTIDLSWEAVNASDLSGYNVYRSTSSINDVSGKDPVNGSVLSNGSYTDEGLTNGTTYHYVVTAVDDSGNESGPSLEVKRTPFEDPPGRPQ
jgi:TolB protein